MKGYAISSSVDEAPITEAMAVAITKGLRRLEQWWRPYLSTDVTWGGEANVDVKWSPTIGDMLPDPDYCVVHVVPKLDDPHVVAYHTYDFNRPICLISWAMVQVEGGSLVGPDGLISAISHEVFESRVDATCAKTARMPDGLYTPLEVCDWVQGTDYCEPGSPEIYIANAVGPRFFVVGAQGRLDIRSDVTEPAVTQAFQETPEGYHEVEQLDGSVTQVFGSRFPECKKPRIIEKGTRGGERAIRRSLPR